MLASRAFHAPVCASCRLRSAIAAKQLARCRRPSPFHRQTDRSVAPFGTSKRLPQRPPPAKREEEGKEHDVDRTFAEDPAAEAEGVRYARELLERGVVGPSPEKAALMARETYGARLPEGVLDAEAWRVYERFYGRPLGVEGEGEEGVVGGVRVDGIGGDDVVVEESAAGTGILREVGEGELEEVEFEEFGDEEVAEGEEELEMDGQEGDNARLRADIEASLLLDTTEPGLEDAETAQDEPSDPQERAHPLTTANRFGTSPTSLPLPADSLVDPISRQLSGTNNKHLASAAHKSLGGTGLPYGPATPKRAKTMQAKPIQIDAFQHNIGDIEGQVFLAAILPGVYASVVSVLTETRKRLGTAWAENLVKKAEQGELRILDAGGAGAGVLAVRDMLRAEWERMHEERGTRDSGTALAEAGGRLGGAGVSPPLGSATVVTGSDVLRHRASKLLENTTFVPRLPDYIHTAEARAKGKFDLVIAPHTLWGGFRFDRERKTHVQNLWSLVDAEGGVLCLLEKGVSRGFEVVAGAREMLLRTRIKSSGSTGSEFDEEAISGAEIEWEGSSIEEAAAAAAAGGEGAGAYDMVWEKEKGTIIAPCTNHAACPMYRPKGFVKGRRDVCAFEQRYVRPPFLQRILGATDKNFEDVKFAYLSVMRGRDLLEEQGVRQDEAATAAAFAGYETPPDDIASDGLSLALPRAVLPPLKRKGHVLLDLCTSAGKLERWTVPRSFSRQAFRDARKSGWGDLWASGAKTRVLRVPRIGGKHVGRLTKGQRAEVRGMGLEGGEERAGDDGVVEIEGDGGGVGETVLDTDEYGNVVVVKKVAGGGAAKGEGGRMRTGRKVGGLRDKRDKSGRGNGRRKMGWTEE